MLDNKLKHKGTKIKKENFFREFEELISKILI